MGNFLINTLGIFLLIMLGVFLFYKLNPGYFDRQLAKRAQQVRNSQKKNDEQLLGRRMTVPREGKNGVRVNLYEPKNAPAGKVPVIFLAHGGTFMDGSADQMDTFCSRCCEQWDALIVNIDYTTMDVQPFPYSQEEIRDTVLYFAVHASDFNADPHRFAMAGFTAGAYLLVGAAALLKEEGFTVKGLISFYPVVDDAMIHICDIGRHVSPFTLVTTGEDAMKDRYPVYIEHLEGSGVEVNLKSYESCVQNFVEYNNPEFKENPQYQNSKAIDDDQAELARACEIWMGSEFQRFFETAE
ncbi:MAG: alpha/beta hydrolase [Erysipelotrichaceae bacterium]|nr:alpha/beta hydrolase [Erysipelotrichaceae bacterium]